MTDDFCKVSITKRFMKCKSLHTDECYVMIGGTKSQKKTADKIHKKFKSGSNPLQSIKDNKKTNFLDSIGKQDLTSYVNFNELLKNTKQNGTPALRKEVELKTSFKLINLDIGDIVIFSNTCPHRSKKNLSDKNRRIIYYTYSLEKNGSKYDEYFEDKEKSKNESKALAEK